MNKKRSAMVSEYVITRNIHANITPNMMLWTVRVESGKNRRRMTIPPTKGTATETYQYFIKNSLLSLSRE